MGLSCTGDGFLKELPGDATGCLCDPRTGPLEPQTPARGGDGWGGSKPEEGGPPWGGLTAQLHPEPGDQRQRRPRRHPPSCWRRSVPDGPEVAHFPC